MIRKTQFEWDESKNQENIQKHGVSFYLAQYAFADSNRVILEDQKHGHGEKRKLIRIFGAGYWRKGKKIYEEQNKIH